MDDTHPLEKYRQAEQISKAELARRLGLERATITRYTKDGRRVARHLWNEISEKTGIPVAALAGLVEWKPRSRAKARAE